MTKDERDELMYRMRNVTVEPTEPMNLEQIKSFVRGYEAAYLSILDCIERCYRDVKTD